jgi:hypothetical protein
MAVQKREQKLLSTCFYTDGLINLNRGMYSRYIRCLGKSVSVLK